MSEQVAAGTPAGEVVVAETSKRKKKEIPAVVADAIAKVEVPVDVVPTEIAKASPKVETAIDVTPRKRPPFEGPEGWEKLPIELTPFWVPNRCKSDLTGILLRREHLAADGLEVLVFNLIEAADVLLASGEVGRAKVSSEVMVPLFHSLSTVALLLARQEVRYRVRLGGAYKLDVEAADVWVVQHWVDPKGIPVRK